MRVRARIPAGAPAAVRVLPVLVVAGLAVTTAWHDRGSIAAQDWARWALLVALLVAIAAAAGAAPRLSRRLTVAVAALFGLAAWDAASIAWSPLPSKAREEALLAALFALAVLVPGLTLRSARERLAAVAAVTFASGGTAFASAIVAAGAGNATDVYLHGRLDYPVSYPNAQAAFALLGLWPGLALAADRAVPAVVRVLAVAAAAAGAGSWAATQSKGGAIGAAVGAVVAFSVSRERIRLVVPAAIVAVATAAFFHAIAEPYRVAGAQELPAIHHAGRAQLALAGVAAAAAAVYVLLDWKVRLSARVSRIAGRALLAALVAAVVAGIGGFFVKVDHPRTWLDARWRSFKHLSRDSSSSTHLLELGSNRYDFWRVSLDEFRRHPVAGIGARGFRAAYFEHRRSPESPARAHSVELDALAETGIVGFVLLALGIGFALAAAAWRSRDDLVRLGALAAGAAWLAQASVDWTWTFPAIGLLVALLLGTAASRDTALPLPRLAAIPVAAVALVVAVLGFLPVWLSTRYVARALADPGSAAGDLRHARGVDPLAVDPYVAESVIYPGTPRAVAALERAVGKEPRSVDLVYLLGRAQLSAGDAKAARRTLRRALALDPHDPTVQEALRQATRVPSGG